MNDIIAIILVAVISESLIRELPDYCEPDYYKDWSTNPAEIQENKEN
jgi:hypothetical protein